METSLQVHFANCCWGSPTLSPSLGVAFISFHCLENQSSLFRRELPAQAYWAWNLEYGKR